MLPLPQLKATQASFSQWPHFGAVEEAGDQTLYPLNWTSLFPAHYFVLLSRVNRAPGGFTFGVEHTCVWQTPNCWSSFAKAPQRPSRSMKDSEQQTISVSVALHISVEHMPYDFFFYGKMDSLEWIVTREYLLNSYLLWNGWVSVGSEYSVLVVGAQSSLSCINDMEGQFCEDNRIC